MTDGQTGIKHTHILTCRNIDKKTHKDKNTKMQPSIQPSMFISVIKIN